MQNPIDINNSTQSIRHEQQNPNDAGGVRFHRIYGEAAEMLRLHNAYRPNKGGKYDLNKVMRKRADYELRQLQNAFTRARQEYAKENNMTILEYETKLAEQPELVELVFQKALASLPKQLKTIIGNAPVGTLNNE